MLKNCFFLFRFGFQIKERKSGDWTRLLTLKSQQNENCRSPALHHHRPLLNRIIRLSSPHHNIHKSFIRPSSRTSMVDNRSRLFSRHPHHRSWILNNYNLNIPDHSSTPSVTSATRSKGYTVSVDEEPQHKHHHLLGYNMETAPTTPTSANQPMLIAVTPNEVSSAYSRTQSSSEMMSRLTSESMMTSKLPGHEIQPNNPLQMVYYLVHPSSLSLDATATSLEEVKRQPAVDNNNTDVNYTSYRDVAMGNSTPLFTDNNT